MRATTFSAADLSAVMARLQGPPMKFLDVPVVPDFAVPPGEIWVTESGRLRLGCAQVIVQGGEMWIVADPWHPMGHLSCINGTWFAPERTIRALQKLDDRRINCPTDQEGWE